MATYYDEVDLDDMEFDESSGMYSYPCPCGDQFLLSLVCTVTASAKIAIADPVP